MGVVGHTSLLILGNYKLNSLRETSLDSVPNFCLSIHDSLIHVNLRSLYSVFEKIYHPCPLIHYKVMGNVNLESKAILVPLIGSIFH